MLPAIVVDWADSTTIRPPLPNSDPSAATLAPLWTTTAFAVRAGVTNAPPAARASVVPTATVPPPARPEAITTDPDFNVTVSLASSSIAPPLVPGARPTAESWPSISIEPPMPLIEIDPVLSPTVFAEIFPPAEIRVCTIPSAARAVSCTVPPAARMIPVLVTNAVVPSGACVTCPVTFTDSNPSPYISRVTACAPASTTVPSLALMTPELATRGATSAARPAWLTVIVPRFSTFALRCAAWSNTMLPAMKFALLMPTAVTISPVVLTWAPSKNVRPD